jgi:hypothetical protein
MMQLEQLYYSGSVVWKSPEAMQVYDMYCLVKLGIRPWEVNGSGQVYQEDLMYILKCKELEAAGMQARLNDGGGSWKKVG